MHYPMVVQPSYFLQHVLSLSHNELQSSENKHYCLYQFLLRRPELNAGIRLLPPLVEFYRWVHSHLSFLVNREQSTQLSIGKTLERFLDKNYQGFKNQLMSKFLQLIGKSMVSSNNREIFYHLLLCMWAEYYRFYMQLSLSVHNIPQLSESTRLSDLIGTDGILFSTIGRIVSMVAIPGDIETNPFLATFCDWFAGCFLQQFCGRRC